MLLIACPREGDPDGIVAGATRDAGLGDASSTADVSSGGVGPEPVSPDGGPAGSSGTEPGEIPPPSACVPPCILDALAACKAPGVGAPALDPASCSFDALGGGQICDESVGYVIGRDGRYFLDGELCLSLRDEVVAAYRLQVYFSNKVWRSSDGTQIAIRPAGSDLWYCGDPEDPATEAYPAPDPVFGVSPCDTSALTLVSQIGWNDDCNEAELGECPALNRDFNLSHLFGAQTRDEAEVGPTNLDGGTLEPELADG
jgi:hypothetical protein